MLLHQGAFPLLHHLETPPATSGGRRCLSPLYATCPHFTRKSQTSVFGKAATVELHLLPLWEVR